MDFDVLRLRPPESEGASQSEKYQKILQEASMRADGLPL